DLLHLAHELVLVERIDLDREVALTQGVEQRVGPLGQPLEELPRLERGLREARSPTAQLLAEKPRREFLDRVERSELGVERAGRLVEVQQRLADHRELG